MGNRDGQDPIQWATEAGRDLYDIATWEERTRLDEFAVSVYHGLLASGRALLILAALVIVLSQFAVTVVATTRDPLLGLYIALSIVPALLLAVVLWRSDVIRREPFETLVATFILGFVMAGFAAVFNVAFQGLFVGFGAVGMVLYFFLIVGPIEESVKLLAVRLHAFRTKQFDAVIDGAVYGAMAGLGFAAIENTMYITQQYLALSAPSAGAARTLQMTAIRTFAGPGHVIYSAFAGYYLGLAKFNPDNKGPIVVKGLLIAVGIHASYNILVSHLEAILGFVPVLGSLPQAMAFFGFVIVYDGVFFLILLEKLRRYKRVFGEVGAETFYQESGESDQADEIIPVED